MANNCGYWRIGVSIPIGFSSSLQHVPYDGSIAYTTQFQSLSGFQVRCNFKWRRLALARRYGFNPYRVFKFVATERLGIVQLQVYRFQSLSGFQVRCNPWSGQHWKPPEMCFNPYRVFKFVATLRLPGSQGLPGTVSIPIGFSSSLQRSIPISIEY